MKRQFNKLGSIEIAENTFKYRMSIQDLGLDNPVELEKEIKRKLVNLSEDVESLVLLPFSIEVINRYMVLYYDMNHFVALDYLRELELYEKIPYYLSIIKLAQAQEKGERFSWERVNFVCDKYEQKVKAILFEAGSLKIYETPNDILKTTKDLICTTMTTLTTVINLPKRQDFISPNDENIQFVENLYRLDNLDDIYMYLETLEIELNQGNEESMDDDEKQNKNKKKKKKKKIKAKNNKQKKKVISNNDFDKAAIKRKKENKKIIMFGSVVILVLLLYLGSTLIIPSNADTDSKEKVVITSMDNGKIFKGSASDKKSLVDAYRNAYNSEYEGAYASLSSIAVHDLDSRDIPLLIQVYERTNNIPQLLDESPTLANEVITYLLTKDKLGEIVDISEKMTSKNPYIEFEKAHYNSEYEYMLSFIKDIEINGRKEGQIMDAYLELGMLDEARRFAEKVGNPDLIKRVEENRR